VSKRTTLESRTVTLDQHLTVADVADLLACSTRTILRHLEAGELRPALNINGRWRVSARAVAAYINRKRV